MPAYREVRVVRTEGGAIETEVEFTIGEVEDRYDFDPSDGYQCECGNSGWRLEKLVKVVDLDGVEIPQPIAGQLAIGEEPRELPRHDPSAHENPGGPLFLGQLPRRGRLRMVWGWLTRRD